ncbi:hypothetical protein IB269_07675 [Delftia sp. DLF01]|uniref:hypothetical protein n=1 Tax=Delftia sp. DLF01 TaxID=2769279 RepID=UPI0017821292|nr:hypothetical protein [Delftia sp. DLF01]MBD9581248.1 hypothetical protein [Delftia sp. DLF01]
MDLKIKSESTSENDLESLEHILPNALGGKLKSKDILSHFSNQKLNNFIDKEFVKIFESFCLRLELEKDRKTTPSMRGIHNAYGADVIFKKNRFYPSKPIFDQDKKIIYADSKKTGNDYKKFLLKEGKITNSDVIEVLDDMAGGIELKFTLDNKIFKQGLAKISAGFAALKGVPRESMRDVIDIKNKEFREKIIIIPSIPKSHVELKFERNALNGPHYPIHGLVLTGSKNDRLLYCHVELFSAFQWYVVLDDNYEGEDIRHTYAHQLIGDSEITINEYLEGVVGKEQGDILAMNYKYISRDEAYKFQAIHSNGNLDLRKYTYFKFNSLSAFANMVFLKRKMELLSL